MTNMDPFFFPISIYYSKYMGKFKFLFSDWLQPSVQIHYNQIDHCIIIKVTAV